MAICSVKGCGARINKPGHYLCMDHWRASRDGGVQQCEDCGTWTETREPLCRDCNQSIKSPASAGAARPLTATTLGTAFDMSAQKMNLVLAELGWIEKTPRTGLGWVPTPRGKKQGATQRSSQSGTPYVMWPGDIARNPVLRHAVNDLVHDLSESAESEATTTPIPAVPKKTGDVVDDFRTRFPAEYRTPDGHMVRSRAEVLIDTWLYMHGIVHAYERRLPIEETVYCDFYIPIGGSTFIEYWGMEEKASYRARMEQKQRIYSENQLNLIELGDSDVYNLDDILPKKLLSFDIKVQ